MIGNLINHANFPKLNIKLDTSKMLIGDNVFNKTIDNKKKSNEQRDIELM
jgi:hypothetical protein